MRKPRAVGIPGLEEVFQGLSGNESDGVPMTIDFPYSYAVGSSEKVLAFGSLSSLHAVHQTPRVPITFTAIYGLAIAL